VRGIRILAFRFLPVAVLLVGRAWILYLAPAGLSGDALGYVARAVHIATTGQLPPLNLQPNGFPLLLAPFYVLAGDQIAARVLWAHCAMDILIVASLVFVIERSLDDRTPSWMKLALCVLVLVQPFTATMVNGVYADMSSGFFVFFAIFLLSHAMQRRKWGPPLAFSAGLIVGIAATERVDLLPVGVALLGGYSLVTLTRENPERRNYVGAIAIVCSVLLPPLALAGFQYASTGEVGLIKVVKRYEDPGYFAWLRTSFLTESEYRPLAWSRGSTDWEGFAISRYPSRMFDSSDEKEMVRGLLNKWKNDGMSPQIDAGFSDLAQRKIEARRIRNYVALPALRMLNDWINVDGAQTLLRVIPLKRPWSQLVVGLVLGLRLIVVALGAVGIFSLVRPPRTTPLSSQIMHLAFFAAIAIAVRTLELGALSPFLEAGLREYRYVGMVFPAALILAIWGADVLTTGRLGRALVFGHGRNSESKVQSEGL
jgi:hypothetical protein